MREADGRLADAPGFRRYLVEKIAGYERGLRTMRARMARKAQGALTVEFRTVHMSPFLKLYVVGDEVVFEGIYDKLDSGRTSTGRRVPRRRVRAPRATNCSTSSDTVRC